MECHLQKNDKMESLFAPCSPSDVRKALKDVFEGHAHLGSLAAYVKHTPRACIGALRRVLRGKVGQIISTL